MKLSKGFFSASGVALVLAGAGCKPADQTVRVEALEKEVERLTERLAAAESGDLAKMKRELENAKIEHSNEMNRLEREHRRAVMMLEGIEKDRKVALSGNGEGDPALDPEPPSLAELKEAVVAIEGDRARATGFLVKTDGKHYVYTAATALGGNSRLTISSVGGRKFSKFGQLEVAEGLDLVRLEVLEDEVGKALEIATEDDLRPGLWVTVLEEKAGGTGQARGSIEGTSDGEVRVRAGALYRDNGGPVVLEKAGKVAGMVVRATGKREEMKADGEGSPTDGRRTLRLDQELKWSPVAPADFLSQSREVAGYDRFTRLGMVISKLEIGASGERLDVSLGGKDTLMSVLNEMRELPYVEEFITAPSKTKVTEPESKKQMKRLVTAVLRDLERGEPAFARFNEFHRRDGELSVTWRKQVVAALKEKLGRL